MIRTYTGNGAYCYANSLTMCLYASTDYPEAIPEPWFIECLTLMPFGTLYLRLDDAPLVFFSSPLTNPDNGLQRAIERLGWRCQEWYGEEAEEALDWLRAALTHGPVLMGPVDVGYLSYLPGCPNAPRGDHYVVALAVEDDNLLLHDPAGFPFARISIHDFLAAWKAECIAYKRGSYTLRWDFRPSAPPPRSEMIARTLPSLSESILANPGGPVVYGGVQALQLLADDLGGDVPESLEQHLTNFALPLGARRSLDAARFLQEAGNATASENLTEQAQLFGKAGSFAARGQWNGVADIMAQLGTSQSELARSLNVPQPVG